MQDLASLLPLFLTGTGAVLLMLYSVCRKADNNCAAFFTVGIFAVAFLLQLIVINSPERELFPGIFNGLLAVSSFTNLACLILYGCGFFTSLASISYFSQNKFVTPEFYSLLLYSTVGMVLLTLARELITAFIALEIMSLAIYILVGYDRSNLRASEAVFKYLILGAFAGTFFCLGAALIFGAAGSTKFVVLAEFAGTHSANQPLLVGGIFLLLITIFFKIAAFPFHAWIVDVYDGAASVVTGFMATALKTAVFTVFVNIITLNSQLHDFWVTTFFWVAVLTMFGGNLIAIGQNNIKRMIAASGIVHSGYLLIAVIALDYEHFSGGVVLYYLVAYSVATLGLFSSLSFLGGEDEKRVCFKDFKGLASKQPLAAATITVFLLSMAGIPPTAGFMGKFYIIITAIDAEHFMLVVLCIVSSILSLWYYLRLVVNMYFYRAEEDFSPLLYSLPGQTGSIALAISVFALAIFPLFLQAVHFGF